MKGVVWTDLLPVGDEHFDRLEPATRDRLYLRLISPTRWVLSRRGLLGAKLPRPALPTEDEEPQ